MRDIMLEEQMKWVRLMCSIGQHERKKIGIKIRQPLNSVSFKEYYGEALKGENFDQLVGLIKDDLNVKDVLFTIPSESIDQIYTNLKVKK